jgi:hypothetical protein
MGLSPYSKYAFPLSELKIADPSAAELAPKAHILGKTKTVCSQVTYSTKPLIPLRLPGTILWGLVDSKLSYHSISYISGR